MPTNFEPGDLVMHPQYPEWGRGQVQSVIAEKVTANFEHVGKVVIHTSVVKLETVTFDS